LGKSFDGEKNGFPSWENATELPVKLSQLGKASPNFRWNFPNLGKRRRTSGGTFPVWERVFFDRERHGFTHWESLPIEISTLSLVANTCCTTQKRQLFCKNRPLWKSGFPD
jgi:hypothetical protein